MANDSGALRQWERGWHDRDRAALVEALVRACLMIVGQELFEHRLQVAGAEYQQTSMPSERKTWSKPALNFESRSRSR